MKRIISFILAMLLIAGLAGTAFAAGEKKVASPTMEWSLVPNIFSSYFKVCDANGKLVRYLSVDEITCEPPENLKELIKIKNLLYAFNFSSTYELKEGEYIEFPFQFRTERTLSSYVYETENELKVEKIIDAYWMLYITEYGTIIVTVNEE